MTTSLGPRRQHVERLRGLRTSMGDGVELVADLWRPAGAGRLPVLLQRLPYGRSVASSPVLPSPAHLAALGYAVLVQDVRGTGDSGGVFRPFHDEAEDGAATIEWAAAQGFSTGDVVTYGFSYQGLDQIAAAALRPAGLRGIAPMMCAATPYGLVYEDGCLMLEHATRWAAQLGAIADGRMPRPVDPGALPIGAALGDDPPDLYRDWTAHEDPGDAFWAEIAPDLSRVQVPSFVVLGYADTFAKATARLARALGAEVVAGPWAHMPWGSRLGGLELGPDAGPATAHAAFAAFLERVLGGGPAAEGPPTRYFVGGEGWRTAASWPPAGRAVLLHASSDEGANSRHGDGRLTELPPAGLTDLLVAEPLAPHPAASTPYLDVSADEDRRDVLCYTSAPLEGDRAIVGSPHALVAVAADGPSFDLFASLVLVDDHTARRLSIGAQRITPPEPGAPVEVRIELGPIGWRLGQGSRLRLDLAATSFPLYGRNPQSGIRAATRQEHAVATITLSSAALEVTLTD